MTKSDVGGEPTPPAFSCPKCGEVLSQGEFLDSFVVSWPNQEMAWFECRKCHRGMHAHPLRDAVEFGDIDGAPGPCFICEISVPVPGLMTKFTGASITLSIGRARRRIPAKA